MLRRVLTAAALFSALAVVLTWPVALRIGGGVPADLGDPLLNTWILWWNTRAVPLTAAWWNAPAFYPSTGVLAYSEHLLGLAIFTTPLMWLGASPLAAYSVALLGSYVVAGLGAWALARALTGRDDAALLAGIAFTAAPYRLAQISHLQVLMAGWMPFALVGLHRFVETRRWPWLALFAGGWLVQGLTNGYYLLFFGVLAALWIAWFVFRRGGWSSLPWIVCAAFLVAAAMVPFLAEYRAVHDHYGFKRGAEETAVFSADVLSPLDASPRLLLWGGLRAFHRAEGELFPGLGLPLILVAGALLGHRPTLSRQRRLVCAALLVALVSAAALLASYGFVGRWRVDLLGIRIALLSPRRPLFIVLLAGLGLLATWPGIVEACRRRSALLFYAVAAVMLFFLALGPDPTVAGTPLDFPAPYAWLMYLPGFAGLRVPARLWMVALTCLSASLSLAWVRLPIAPERRHIFAAVAACLLVADGLSAGVPVMTPPAPWPSMVDTSSTSPILEVPGGVGRGGDLITMYRAMPSARPVIAGYSGYFPPSSFIARRALTEGDTSIASALAAKGPADVLLDRWTDRRNRWQRWLAAQPLRTPPRVEGRWTLYALERQPSAGPPPTTGARLATTRVWASIHDNVMSRALDGQMETSWFAVQQLTGETITLDLGTARPLGSVRLWHGASATDYSRGLVAERSDDQARWTPMWEGSTAGLAWLGADEDPSTTPVTIPLDGCAARFLRLRQTVLDEHPWTIFELAVYEPGPGAAACPSGGMR